METLSTVKSQQKEVSNYQYFIFSFLILFCLCVSHSYGSIWTGSADPDDSWSNGYNWLDGLPPASTDYVIFNAGDSGNINVVDIDFTIAGLQYIGNGTHTTNFNGSSNLQIDGPLYVGYGGSEDGAVASWTNGGLVTIGSPGFLQSFYISVNPTTDGSNTSSLLLDGPDVYAHVADLTIGGKMNTTGYGTANGSLILGGNSSLHVGTADAPAVLSIGMNQSSSYYTNPYGTVITSGGDGTGLLDATQGSVELHLSELNVGRHTGYYGTATGTLRWDQPEPIDVTNVFFGRGPSTGILDVPEGGTFLLGTMSDPLSLLAISYNDTGRGTGASAAHLDLTDSDPTFEAFSSTLTIGAKTHTDGYGTADGSLVLGSNSSLHVGTVDDPGVVNIGMNRSSSYTSNPYGTSPTSGGNGTGLLDATQGSVEFHLSELNVGRHTGKYGSSVGTFTMGNSSHVMATTVNVGTTSGGTATGTLNLTGGLLAAQTVNMGAGGTFNFTDGRLAIGTFNTYGGTGALEQRGGTLTPGFSHTETSLPGIATINGDFILYSGGIFEVELFGLTAGLEYDQLVVNGAVDLNADFGNGGKLDVILGFAPEIGDEFIIINNDGWDEINGNFFGLFELDTFNKIFLDTIFTFEISYLGYTGNDVVLRMLDTQPVPVPSAILLGMLGLSVAGMKLRKYI